MHYKLGKKELVEDCSEQRETEERDSFEAVRRKEPQSKGKMQIEQCLFMPCSEYSTEGSKILKSNGGPQKIKRVWQSPFKTSSITRHLKSLKETTVVQTFINKSRLFHQQEEKEQCKNDDATQEKLTPQILSTEMQEIPLLGKRSHMDEEEISGKGSTMKVKKETDNATFENESTIPSQNKITNTPKNQTNEPNHDQTPVITGHHNSKVETENSATAKEKRTWFRRSKSYSPTRLLGLTKGNYDSPQTRKNKVFKTTPNRRSNSLRDFRKKSRSKMRRNTSQESLNVEIAATQDAREDQIRRDAIGVSNVTLPGTELDSLTLVKDQSQLKIINCTSKASKEWKSSERYPLGLMKATTKLSVLPSVVFPWRRDDPKGSKLELPNVLRNEGNVQEDLESSFGIEEHLCRNVPCDAFPDGEQRLEVVRQEALEEAPPPPSSPSSSYGRNSVSRSEWDIHRPRTDTYTDCHAPSLSQSECRLSLKAEHPHLNQEDGERIEALSLPYTMASENLAHTLPEGKFQKFKKSLSLRLAKKGSRGESPCRVGQKPPQEGDRSYPDAGVTQPNKNSHRDEELNKSTYFKFGHPLFRTSKERKRDKLRDSRASKCNSGDSGDSGIELASGTSTLVGDVAHHNDETLLFVGNNLDRNEEQTNIFTADSAHNEIPKQKVLRRTRSDMSKSRSPQRHLLAGDAYHRQSLGRQYSSPQPMKVRPYHRLPNYSADPSQRNSGLKRSKGSTHLRRSVSQPLDLDKSFMAQISFLKMRVPDEPLVKKQCRRPSVGNLLSDDNTSEEEGGLSDNEDLRQEFKRCLEDEEDVIVFAEALWDHVSLDSDELVFKAGELITVLDSSDKDWWWGRTTRRSGWFPASFVRLLVNQEDHQQEEETGSIAEDANGSPRRLSLSSLSHDQVRANVINEILCTERDYVKHLKDVVEGYLRQVRKRPDMFSAETIATIFGNMEAVFDFHSQFLNELELCIDYDNPHRSCVGDCFIRNKSRFEIYSEYCNNHPSAVSELQELYQDQKYVHFFEACRLLQEMIDISLDGFLLTPVQKICKYPLQLQELLKYTKPNHPDYSTVRGATQAMKEVALLVNERRRRMECLEKIASWQKGVEGWEGADLLDDSSQLIHQGEVTKGVGGSWPKEMTLFLFDHQMIYCKRDLLKRNTFVYRGRINTDLCEVIDIPDDPVRSAAFQNAWKIHYLHKSKTYAFTCKTAEEKTKWLQAFKRERALVALDEASGFVASEKQKQVARMAARNQRSRPKKPRVKSRSRKQVMTYAQAQRLVNTKKAEENRSNSLPVRSQPPPSEVKKKGHWFSFGGNKKGRNSGRTQKISNTLHTS